MTTWSNLQEHLFLQKILGYICRPATNNIYLSQAIALRVSIFYFRRIERHKVLIMKYMLFKNSIHQKYHNSCVVFKLPAKLAIDPKKLGRRKMGEIVKATDDIKSHVEEKYFPNQKYLELVVLKSN